MWIFPWRDSFRWCSSRWPSLWYGAPSSPSWGRLSSTRRMRPSLYLAYDAIWEDGKSPGIRKRPGLWGLKFLPPDNALCLLGQDARIDEAYCPLIPLLAFRAPPYNEVLDWIQCSHTVNWLGAYVATGSIKLTSRLSRRGGGVFDPALHQIQTLFLWAYTQGSMSKLGPLGPDYDSEQ